MTITETGNSEFTSWIHSIWNRAGEYVVLQPISVIMSNKVTVSIVTKSSPLKTIDVTIST